MADPFHENAVGLTSPGVRHFAITPHNTNDLANMPRAIYVGGDGDLAMHDADGNAVTWVGLVAGTIIPFRAKRVLVTGTSATNLVGIY